MFLKRERPPRPKRERDPSAPKRQPKTVLHVEQEPPEVGADGEYAWHYRPQDVEQSGTFYFRGALLNDLAVYFKVLAKMKGAHKDAYEFYSRIGATLTSPRALIPLYQLPAFWHDPDKRPGFGAVAMSLDHDDTRDMLWPRLLYFMKMHIPPPHVEPTSGDVYEITAYFDHRKDNSKAPKFIRKHGLCLQFHVAVEGARCRSLKHLQTRYKPIRYRSGGGPSNRSGAIHTTNGHTGKTLSYTEHIPQKLWDYPPWLTDWANEHEKEKQDSGREGPDVFGWTHLTMIANLCIAQETGVRIEVTDAAGLHASFAVEPKRMAYFFKDRETVIKNGKRARIFHIVRPHERVLPSGKTITTRMHFRGLRTFPWAGYTVHITMPGLHHEPLFECTVGVEDWEAAHALGKEKSDQISMAAFGEILHSQVHGRIAEARRKLLDDSR